MTRRDFVKKLVSSVLGFFSMTAVHACMAPLISATARDKNAGDPWQCMNCGHLTRTHKDLSGTRCPRCMQRMLVRISEEEMTAALKKLGA